MVENWNFLVNETEINILKESGEMGRLLTMSYLGGYLNDANIKMLLMNPIDDYRLYDYGCASFRELAVTSTYN